MLIRSESPSAPTTSSSGETEKVTSGANVPAPKPSASVPQSNQDETDFSSVLTPQEKALLATGYVLTAEEREKLLKKKRGKDLLPTTEELKVMFDTPVEFYGRVLDQSDNPVVGAEITCSWPYMGPMSSPVRLQSAAPNGQFEISGLKANAITIFVEPPQGYAQLPESKNRIQFAKTPERIFQNSDYKTMTHEQKELFGKMHGFGEAHKPDKTQPVIFRLKKL